MNHDRIHSRPPQQDPDRWREGVIVSITHRDGHAVFTVAPVDSDGESTDDERPTIELTVTTAVRELVVGRLAIDEDESPVGEHVWFRQRGS